MPTRRSKKQRQQLAKELGALSSAFNGLTREEQLKVTAAVVAGTPLDEALEEVSNADGSG